eukprot:TRINITY_DN15702_c0_g1_i1.p2 TRINITY_DN15702_c0_g1~~TRINITY_DN15702_c0_g1_i1.p2  ORF type:complete len:140 (+),score=39.26 TRINITY_DN15702_c0_g1_i1:64-483(+)
MCIRDRCTMFQIKNGQREFDLTNPKVKNPGKLKLVEFISYERPEFLDYIRGGLQLNLVVAVDFTGSNGVPTRPDSLHAINLDGRPNQYQAAIQAVGEILLNYDYDKRVPLYGFGGKPKYPGMHHLICLLYTSPSPRDQA